MYRLVTLLLILFCSFSLNAQNIPNYQFENWNSYTPYDNPVSWGSSNFTVLGVVTFETVFNETTDVYSGESSVKLVTTEKNVSGEDIKVVGLITLGIFDVDLSTRQAVVKGGVPVIEKPSVLSGYYKYSTSGEDSCVMSIFVTKYDHIENKRDTLGIGVFTSSNQSEWTLFEAPVNYTSEADPDSLNIVILSSDTSIFDPGSTLLVDNLYIDGTVGISHLYSNDNVKIYPNPAKNLLNIEIPSNKAKVSIYNSIGKMVKTFNISKQKEVDISSLKSGIYFISITIDERRISKKIIVN